MSDALVLGLDTCTKWLHAALVGRDGEVLASHREEVRTHTTRILVAAEEMLSRAGRSRSDLAGLGIVTGPGSFTGLRVGISTALGLQSALAAPAFGIGSLEALARSVPWEGDGMALLDARRSEIYLQKYRRTGEAVIALEPPEALPPAEVEELARGASWAVGDGVPLVEGWRPSCRLLAEVPNLAIPAALQAWKALREGRPGEPLTPLYVRAPDVRAPR